MQSYDPNQPQSYDGYYHQQPPSQNQPRISLPPASSFFDNGHQASLSAGYHHTGTPLSEPPQSPYVTGSYNQQQSYPINDPNTSYMHTSAISPPNYNMGPPPSHFPSLQQIYDPSRNMGSAGYSGMDESNGQQQQSQQMQMSMGYHPQQNSLPNTSMMHQDNSMQMNYMPSMDQGMMGNYPQPHPDYTNMPHPAMHHMPQQLPQAMMQMPPHQQPPSQHSMPPQSFHQHQMPSHQTMNNQSMISHSDLSNNPREMNPMLRNHLQQPPPYEQATSIAPSENMTQVLQMQQQPAPPPLTPSRKQDMVASQLERHLSEGSMMVPSNAYMPPPDMMNMDQRYPGPPSYQHPSQPQSVYPEPMDDQAYNQQPMMPPSIPSDAYQPPSQEYQPQVIEQQPPPQVVQEQPQKQQRSKPPPPPEDESMSDPDFSTILEPSQMDDFPSSNNETDTTEAESSIAATVAEVIAKNSVKKAPPRSRPPKTKRCVKSFELPTGAGSADGLTVREHLQAQQQEKKMQERQERYMQKIKEEEERRLKEREAIETVRSEAPKAPAMTRTAYLQAHRQKRTNKKTVLEKKLEKDTVTRIIEEIAGKNPDQSHQASEPSQPQEPQEQQPPDEDVIQILDDPVAPVAEDEATKKPVKQKRPRKKAAPRETKAQRELRQKVLFKCVHLQKTIRSLILKNSALADETSRLFYRIRTVTEERKMLAKRLQHFERNRIRRIQSQKKKRARAEQAMLQEMLLQQEPPSVEALQAPIMSQEEEEFVEPIRAYPFEEMTHKEMAVYMPPLTEDFAQIPYLETGNYEELQGQYPVAYNAPNNFEEYSYGQDEVAAHQQSEDPEEQYYHHSDLREDNIAEEEKPHSNNPIESHRIEGPSFEESMPSSSRSPEDESQFMQSAPTEHCSESAMDLTRHSSMEEKSIIRADTPKLGDQEGKLRESTSLPPLGASDSRSQSSLSGQLQNC